MCTIWRKNRRSLICGDAIFHPLDIDLTGQFAVTNVTLHPATFCIYFPIFPHPFSPNIEHHV